MLTRIPTPRHLLPLTAVITPPTEAVGDSGATEWSYNGANAISVAANLQPVSSRDAMQYGRESTAELYDLFLEPTAALAAFTVAQIAKSQIVVGGKTLRAAGGPIDPITNGCIYQITCERVQ